MPLYMYMCVRGAIRNLQQSRSKKSGLLHDDGRQMTKNEAIDALMDELAEGRETIPVSSKCGNPCGHSSACKGFDFGKNGGCPGYIEGSGT